MKESNLITTRQARILTFIRDRIVSTGRPPTLREIGAHFGFRSTGTTRDHLASLAKKGYLTYGGRTSRSIELKRHIIFRIPIIGRIVAGMPDIAEEEPIGYLELDQFLPRPDKDIFALAIHGESMKEKGITDGDIAIVRKQKLATEGNVIAALIENEATIKILKKDSQGFYLEAANKNFPEIHKPFVIIGKVIAVIKRYA
jgi:repressor LexA